MKGKIGQQSQDPAVPADYCLPSLAKRRGVSLLTQTSCKTKALSCMRPFAASVTGEQLLEHHRPHSIQGTCWTFCTSTLLGQVESASCNAHSRSEATPSMHSMP